MGWDSIRCSRGCAADGSRGPGSHARPQWMVRRRSRGENLRPVMACTVWGTRVCVVRGGLWGHAALYPEDEVR